MAIETGKVTNQQKVVLGVLAVIGLIFFYSKVYAPMGDKIKESQEVLQKKSAELQDTQIKAQQLDVLEEELKLLEEQLKIIEKKLPKTEEIPKFIKMITDIAAKYGMDVKTLDIPGPQASAYYVTHPYGMNLESDYHTFGHFFSEIGQLDRIFNIKDLNLTPLAGEEGEGRLNASFTIVAFTSK